MIPPKKTDTIIGKYEVSREDGVSLSSTDGGGSIKKSIEVILHPDPREGLS